jgi:hypothetical protein
MTKNTMYFSRIYGGAKGKPLETARQRAPVHRVGDTIMRALAEVDRAQGGKGVADLGLIEFALVALANHACRIAFEGADADAAAEDAERQILAFARDVLGMAVAREETQ